VPEIVSLGEILVEIMRTERDLPLDRRGTFAGPFPSGAPAIYIDQVAKLGASAGFIGVCGDDDFGRLVEGRLREDGVDTSCVRFAEGYTTGCAFVAYSSDGSRNFIFHLPHSAAGLLGPEDVKEDYFVGTKLLHIMGSALSVSEHSRQACYRAVRITKELGGLVSLDPNLRPELISPERIRKICEPVLKVADLVLPSGEEVSALTGIPDPEEACRKLAREGKIVGLKLGARGSKIFSPDLEIMVPSVEVREVDPTGAGDCWDAGFTVAYLEGRSLEECARFANVVGALSVTELGPMEGSPSREEVEKLLRSMGN